MMTRSALLGIPAPRHIDAPRASGRYRYINLVIADPVDELTALRDAIRSCLVDLDHAKASRDYARAAQKEIELGQLMRALERAERRANVVDVEGHEVPASRHAIERYTERLVEVTERSVA